jgi:hypothetical protein
MTPKEWGEIKKEMPWIISTATSSTRPVLLGALTLRQINDLANVRGRLPQVGGFIDATERFLARKNNILNISGKILERWNKLQNGTGFFSSKDSNPEMSKLLARVMHTATIRQFDPDPKQAGSYSDGQRLANQDLLEMWKQLTPEAKSIFVDVRTFYEDRYKEYQKVMDDRIEFMKKLGVSETRIANIRKEFEKNKTRGPYFPLMRHGRFWYQVNKGKDREYYMFETRGQKEAHMAEREKQPNFNKTGEGDTFKEQLDEHAKQSEFLRNAFDAIDTAKFSGTKAEGESQRQVLKDGIYQSYLANQPEYSFRSQFIHRNNIAGYSEDALRNFARSSFHMAYQMSRFENSPNMFAQIASAKVRIKDRFDAGNKRGGYDLALSR